jgi:hypothetical protein
MFEERVAKVLTYLEANSPVIDPTNATRALGDGVGYSPPIAAAIIGHMNGMNMVKVERAVGPNGKDTVIVSITLLPETEWLDQRPDWEGQICEYLKINGPVVDDGGFAVARLKELTEIPFSTGHIRNMLRDIEKSGRIHRAINGKRTYSVALINQPLYYPPGKEPAAPAPVPVPVPATPEEVSEIEARRERDRVRKARQRAEQRGEPVPPAVADEPAILPSGRKRKESLAGMTEEQKRAHRRKLAKDRQARKEAGQAMGMIMGDIMDSVSATIAAPVERPSVPDSDGDVDYNKLGRAMVEECGKILASGAPASAELQARIENAETEIVSLRQEVDNAGSFAGQLRKKLTEMERVIQAKDEQIRTLDQQLTEARAQLVKRSASTDIGPEEKKSIQGFLRGLMRDDH